MTTSQACSGEENLVQYGGRYVYIKRVEVKVGRNGHTAYAYLGYDVDRADDEKHKALKRAAKSHLSTKEVHKQLQNTGLFVIICSLPLSGRGDPADVLYPADGRAVF